MADLSRKSGKLLLLASAAILLLVSCTESVAPTFDGTPIRIIEARSITDLEAAFDRYRYDIDHLSAGVPPLIIESLPREISDLNSATRKKTLFVQTLLPMVLLANQEIAQERTLLLELNQQFEENQRLTAEQLHLLITLKKRYALNDNQTDSKLFEKLMRRIDQIPAGLVLAQAANESAWGTSRFSQLGNNLFGEWTFTPGTGIIPEGRPEGATYEVKRFDTLYDSIRSYLRNLNTHSAYASFRQLREEARSLGQIPVGYNLAKGLLNYSTRREAYVLDLQNLMLQNKLLRFSLVSLRQG